MGAKGSLVVLLGASLWKWGAQGLGKRTVLLLSSEGVSLPPSLPFSSSEMGQCDLEVSTADPVL